MKTRSYISPAFKALTLEAENGFLVGSVTDVKIMVASVDVEPFQDGFESDGGFKDISFD